MLSLKNVCLVNIVDPVVLTGNVPKHDKTESEIFSGLIASGLKLESCCYYPVRTIQDMLMYVTVALSHKYQPDITVIHSSKNIFTKLVISNELFSFNDFAKVYWQQDKSFFRRQTIIFTNYSHVAQAYELFEFRKTFCKQILLPKCTDMFSFDQMLLEVGDLIECDELDDLNQACLEHTTLVTKGSLLKSQEITYDNS